MNSDAETYHAAQNGNQAWFFPPDRRCRILSELLYYREEVDKVTSVRFEKPLWTPENEDIEECKWETGESGEIFKSRHRIFEGLKQVPWTLIVFLTLVPDRMLGVKEAGRQMKSLANHVVAPWCDFYGYAAHGGENGVHRHYCLALRCRDAVVFLMRGLKKSAKGYGMYSVHAGFIYGSRAGMAKYMMDPGKSRVLVGNKINSVGFSSRFPKVEAVESEFKQRHPLIRRIIGFNYGIRSEKEYEAADPATKKKLNWETFIRNRAMSEKSQMPCTENRNCTVANSPPVASFKTTPKN